MKHHATPDFWLAYHGLPAEVRELADRAFLLLDADSRHPSLQLKKVGRFWSARVGIHYRAVAVDSADGLIWFWIGHHRDYDRLIRP